MPTPDFQIREGDTDSPIRATLVDDTDAPVDIAGSTVKFRMTPLKGGAAKVDDADATNDQVTDGSDGSKGKVHYQWVVGDTDTPEFFLGEWIVTDAGGHVQTFPNGGYVLISVTPKGTSLLLDAYVTLEEVKASKGLTGAQFADEDLRRNIRAGSRVIDKISGRRPGGFLLDENDVTRYYTPQTARRVIIDDIFEDNITSVATDQDGDMDHEKTDWIIPEELYFTPNNANADGRPYQGIARNLYRGGWPLPLGIPRSVKVVGKFGWPEIPEDIKSATTILAIRFTRRVREAPFAVATTGSLDQATMIRIARSDPDVMMLLIDYMREMPYDA